MSVTHDEALCLRHREWSETSQTVILLTHRHGLINGLAKGSRRERAPFSGGFELLQLGELGFILKPDKDLITLTEWDLANPYTSLRTRYTASVASMFAAELSVSLLAPSDPHPRVFNAFRDMLDTASGPVSVPGQSPDYQPLTMYLAALLDDTGQYPDIVWPMADPSTILLFDPDHARLVPPDPDAAQARDPFSPGADQQGLWPIRRETVDLLLGLSDGTNQAIQAGANPVHWIRAARFLSAWVVYRSGRRPASLDAFLRITR